MSRSRYRFVLCTIGFVLIAPLASAPATAKEPVRIWVDESGRYSVEATLVKRDAENVVLLRRDGGKTAMPVDRLSKRDVEYLKEYDARIKARSNEVSLEAPIVPRHEPLPRLDLPQATFTAPGVAELMLGAVTETTIQNARPKAMPADPTPDQMEFPESRISMTKIDSYDLCSDLISVGTEDKPLLGMSVSVGFSLPGEQTRSRLIQFDPKTRLSSNVYKSTESITLFDHHVASGRSLVLVGHNPLGHGGRLAIASGWSDGEVKIEVERKLPTRRGFGDFPNLRWAKWIDDENVVAVMDNSIVRWNLVSGETYYRIDGVDDKAIPAISGGRRYLALPIEGAVVLFDAKDATPLGRLNCEAKSVPGVSFSQYGGSLAMVTSRRMRTFDLTTGRSHGDIESRRSLGRGTPMWVDHDLVMSSTGVLISVFRGVPIWRYQITGASTISLGDRIAFFRKHPTTGVAVMKMPHQGASDAMEWVDERPAKDEVDQWRIPGRSVWDMSGWADRDVRIGTLDTPLRR